MAEEFDDIFVKHTDGAFYLVNSLFNGSPDNVNPDNIMSFTLTYADSPQSKEFKKIKFWVTRSDARAMAELLAKSADVSPDD